MTVTVTHLELIIGGIATCTTAVIVAARNVKKSIVKPMLRLIDTVRLIAEVVLGKDAEHDRHGVETAAAKPGISERVDRVDDGQAHMISQLAALDDRLLIVEHEFTPDSGGSMKDQLNTITQVVTAAPRSES